MLINKAIAISDAKISFVSLVDKAANKRKFLVTKAKDGSPSASWESTGRIVKADAETHYVTGIVYEPMTEDAHGNYMTAEEIRKAAYWFAKHGDQVDLQHSFEEAEGLSVVENYIAPCDMELGGEAIAKGTWLMTVEVKDDDVWSAVQKGEITGFSMGGIGNYSEEDVDLSETKPTKKSFFERLAGKLEGFIGKGAVKDDYARTVKGVKFNEAFTALRRALQLRETWDSVNSRYVFDFESDEATIREALEDFADIILDTLEQPSVTKALKPEIPLLKAGKKLSSANKAKLEKIAQDLADFIAIFADESEGINTNTNIKKEETDMNEQDIKKIVDGIVDGITKAIGTQTPAAGNTPPVEQEPAEQALTPENVRKMIAEEVKKALTPEGDPNGGNNDGDPNGDPDEVTLEQVQDIVAKALEPLYKQFGLPSNLNNEQQVEKSESVFDGFFA